MRRLPATLAGAAVLAFALPAHAAAPAPQLTVLTYNVEGLPFPVRTGRPAELTAIAASLRSLRERGLQPHVVVLQEAFTPEAKAIATRAGYRYVADGPAVADQGTPARTAADRAFAAQASLLSGEREGKWVDSGLRIASDYPIVAVRRMPFPAYACAGYDCLANKGALAVEVRVPSMAQPVAVIATHLNSRAAAHVPFARSYYAWQRQVDALGGFVRAVVPPSMPMVFAGDFNAGQSFARRRYLVRAAAAWHGATAPEVALDQCLSRADCAKGGAADIGFTARRGRDWQFFAPGSSTPLRLAGLAAVFGRGPGGAMLSDHVGYEAAYVSVPKRIPGLTRFASRSSTEGASSAAAATSTLPRRPA